jgi:hypothetical protein
MVALKRKSCTSKLEEKICSFVPFKTFCMLSFKVGAEGTSTFCVKQQLEPRLRNAAFLA